MKLTPNAQIIDQNVFKQDFLDRLFSWPWRPFQKTVVIYRPRFEKVGNIIYCSPETFLKVKLGELPWPPEVTELDNR